MWISEHCGGAVHRLVSGDTFEEFAKSYPRVESHWRGRRRCRADTRILGYLNRDESCARREKPIYYTHRELTMDDRWIVIRPGKKEKLGVLGLKRS